jgi:hypothetical protein
MSILADDSSSFTAGDVSVVGGDMGSAVTNVVRQAHAHAHAHARTRTSDAVVFRRARSQTILRPITPTPR